MMSTSPPSLQPRQSFHRRQSSTPTSVVAYEAMKVQHQGMIQRPNSQHRRGQSYDSRSPIRRQAQRMGSTVSFANIGSTTQGQQILREAQQQRIARPGQQPTELSESPQCGTFPTTSHLSAMGGQHDTTKMSAMMQNGQGTMHHSQLFAQASCIGMPSDLPMGFELDENNNYFSNSHAFTQSMAMTSMIPDRRMSQPNLRVQTVMRPTTPTRQIQSARFPLTPAATPFSMQHGRQAPQSPSFQLQDEMIQSPRPVSMQKSRSMQSIVEQDEGVTQNRSFEVADLHVPTSSAAVSEPVKSPSKDDSTSNDVAQNKRTEAGFTTDDESLPFFDETGGEQGLLNGDTPVLQSSQVLDGSQSPGRPALSPRRMSISDLNLDPGISASIEETNITLDDIAQFIEGPDAVDNKWICKYEDCNKRFGRKENIKSHVQTHLGDRQFRCDHCHKCFVRGHDLKRHAKIHTGRKPYPCLCGNAFARHDALTRHRQRGMCIGAFDGIVKKVIKRGRPRKHRPEMDDRVDKANRTRQGKAQSEYDQYASSASSCSMSSWGSPLNETMDSLSIRGQSPEDMGIFVLQPNSSIHLNQSLSLPPDMFTFTPPTSPGYSTGNKPSPSYRELTPTDITSISGDIGPALIVSSTESIGAMPDLPSIDRVSTQTRHGISQHSLPSLSHTSSSPAPDVVGFDFGSDDPSLHSGPGMNMGISDMKLALMNAHERNDFDSFFDYGTVDLGLDSTGAENFFAT